MKKLHMASFILLAIGGLNWLLVGAFQWDIGMLFGGMSAGISRAVYILVGLAAVFELVMHKKNCMHCSKGAQSTASSASNFSAQQRM